LNYSLINLPFVNNISNLFTIDTLTKIMVLFPILVFSVSIHEFSHGYTAYRFGDTTAKDEGRLTMNPVAHLSLYGSFIMPLITYIFFQVPFGAAKPVPINPNNLRHPKTDMVWVALAGPASNLIVAVVAAQTLNLVADFGIFGLNGALSYLVIINVALFCFNLIPIPPLDGSRILGAALPWSALQYYRKIEQYGVIIVLILLATGRLSPIIYPVFNFVIKLVSFGA